MKTLEDIKKLHAVTCTNADSCLSYALKRVGLSYKGVDGEEFFEKSEKLKVDDLSKIDEGLIIARVAIKPKEGYRAMSIDESGVAAAEKVKWAFHFYVTERNAILSDFGWDGIRLTHAGSISKKGAEFYIITKPAQ